MEIAPAPAGLPPGLTDSPSRRLLEVILTSLDADKAEDTVVIDLVGKSSIADSMIVTTGRSSRQVASMADHLAERLKAAGFGPVRIEGKTSADWILIDAGDVIVHLFRPEVRAFYNIEKMWGVEVPHGGETEGARTTPVLNA